MSQGAVASERAIQREILVVETRPPLYPSLMGLLQEEGYPVRQVNQDQVRALAPHLPSLAVINTVSTPQQKESLLQGLRQLGESIFIIDLLREGERQSSADIFLREPFTISQLTGVLERLVDENRRASEGH